MYLLETGKVDIRYEGRTLETVESGGIVCEMSLVDDDARVGGLALGGPV